MDRSEPADGNGCHKSASDGDGARDDPRHSSHWRAGASLFRGESYRWFGAVTCDTPNIQRTSPHPGALRAPTLPLQGRVTRGTAVPHKLLWLSSQNGGDLVRLQVQNCIGRSRVAFHSNGSKPVTSWEPSQNGWLLERPQRHHQ